jgi:DNA repair exonuclease SbcCD ATPase subunit
VLDKNPTAEAASEALKTAIVEADAAKAAAAAAKGKVAEATAQSPPAVKREFKTQSVVDTLPVSAFNRIKVPGNGWNLYNAVFIADKIEESGRVPDIKKEMPQMNDNAQRLATHTVQALEDADRTFIDIMMTRYRIPEETNNDMLKEKLKEIDADPALNGDDLKDNIKQSLRFQYQKDSAVYQKDRQGKDIPDADTYMRLLSIPLDSSDLNKGPMASPDISLLLPKIAEAGQLSIYVYRPSRSQPEVYKLVSASRVEGAPIVKLLHISRYDISVLYEKERSDAKAMGLGKVARAIQAAKDKSLEQLADEIEVPEIPPQEYIVVGAERVALVEGSEIAQEFVGMVPFAPNYFPGEDEQTIAAARFVFNTFFTKKERTDRIPPCDTEHFEFIQRGLINRLETMGKEIELQRGRDDDTLELRALIVKFQALEGLINDLEEKVINGACQEYGTDGRPGGFSKIISQQEEEIRSLLRQFAFVVLQAKNPVEKYSDRTEEAINIVEELRNDPLNADTMDTYLQNWNEQAKKSGSSLPQILIEVLERTDTQTGIIDRMAQDQIDELLKDVIGMGRQGFAQDQTTTQTGGGSSLEDFESLITQIEQEDNMPKDKALKIIRWIIDSTRNQWDALRQLKQKTGTMAGDAVERAKEIEALTIKLADANDSMVKIQEQLKAKTEEAIKLEGAAGVGVATEAEIKAKSAVEKESLAMQIEDLKTKLETRTKEYDVIMIELANLRKSCTAGEATAAESAATVSTLNAKLAGLEKELALVKNEKDALKAENERLTAQTTLQASEILELQKSEAAATAAAAAATSKLAGLEGQVAELSKSSQGNAESEAAAKAQITELTAQVEGLETEIKALQSGKTDSEQAAAEAAASIAKLTEQSTSLQEQIKVLEAAAAAAATAAAADAAKLKETEGLLAAARTEVAETTKDKEAIAAKLAAAITQQGVLQKKIDDLYTEWVAKNEELTQVKATAIADKQQAQKDAEVLKGKLTVAENTVNEQLHTIAAQGDSLAKMTEAIKGLEAKVIASTTKIAELEKTVAEDLVKYNTLDAAAMAAAVEAKAQLDKLTAEHEVTKAELAKQKLEYEAQVSALKETIASQTSEIAKLKESLATTTANLATAESEKAKLTTQLSALQRTYNEDIKKLGDSLRAKQLELQTKTTELTAQVNQGKQLLTDAQNKLSELTAQFAAQKVIADQVPVLQTKLEEQKGLADQLPALQKELDEAHVKLDNMPTDSVVAASAVAAAESDLAALNAAQIKAKYPTLFQGKIQKKSDTVGFWNNRDAAMVAAATRVWYIQFEGKDNPHRTVISIQEIPQATKHAGEFTMVTKIKGRDTTYTFKEATGGPTREQWIAKYTELEKVASATTKRGVQQDMNTILSELQDLAASIVNKKEYTVPAGLTPQAGEAFMQIFTSIKKLKADAAPSSSNQACFLSYFIVFFFKTLFFAKTDTVRRQNILKKLDILTNDVLSAVKTAGIFPPNTEDKTIIYKIMEVIFGLIDASETLFINKETRSGNPAQGTDIGLSVIKTAEDATAKKVLEVIYDKVGRTLKADTTFTDDINFIEKALVAGMLISQPKIYFNKPLPITTPANATQDAIDLITYPNMTFMPTGLADIQQKGINTRFQVIDVPSGFKKRQLMVKGIGGTQKQWEDSLSFTMQDTTLQYSTMFAFFVVFGRKYLVAAKEDFIKYSCKIPALMENPASMLTSMSAETPGTSTCIDTEAVLEKKDVDGQPLTKRFRAKFKTPIEDATDLNYEWEYTSTDGNAVKQITRLLFTPEEEKTLKDEEWYRGEAQGKGNTEEIGRHSAMIADLWKRAEERALQGKSTPGIALSKSGELASITFPAPGTYSVSCAIKYKRQGVECVSRPATQKVGQTGGGLDVVVEKPAIAVPLPSCDVILKINEPTVTGLSVSLSTSLTGTLDGMSGQKYRWAYTTAKDKKPIPIPGLGGMLTYDFPETDIYKVTCDLEYMKKGLTKPCMAAQASVKVVLTSATPTPATPKVDPGVVTELVGVKTGANNAIAAAKKAANAIAAKKAALAAAQAKPSGTTIKQNALSMSADNFKASLLARGLSVTPTSGVKSRTNSAFLAAKAAADAEKAKEAALMAKMFPTPAKAATPVAAQKAITPTSGVRSRTNSAFLAAKAAADAEKAKEAALMAKMFPTPAAGATRKNSNAAAKKTGTTIKQNAMSMSTDNFKASLLARGLSGKSLTP